jgi:translocation and assembly module TamB
MRARRAAGWVAIGFAISVTVMFAAFLLLTRTQWGVDRVAHVALDRVERAVDGQLDVVRMEGDVLRRVRLIGVVIRDRQGRPFLDADTIEAGIRFGVLMRQRIELRDVRVVNAHAVLDQPPGEEWNHARIFASEPRAAKPGRTGWGDRVALADVTLVNSRVTVRTEWRPPAELTPAERAAEVRRALAGATRDRVVAVPGGYQRVMDFQQLNAHLPRVTVAHPDTAGIPFRVARLSALVRPFAEPPARVDDLAGDFRILRDSLFMNNVRAALPASRIAGQGVYAMDTGDLLLDARGDPVAFADVRWLYPPLPAHGGGSLAMTLEMRAMATRIILSDMDVAVGDATVRGRLDMTTGDTLRFGESDLRFANVSTSLVERFVDIDFPRAGDFTGRLALHGGPRMLAVDGDVVFDDRAGTVSRIIADGGLGFEPELRFRELQLHFAPLHMHLVRAVAPDLPLDGALMGAATLNGSPVRIAVRGDLVHEEAGERSHVTGTAEIATGPEGWATVDVLLQPLSLHVAGRFVPEAGLHGAVTGRVRAAGDLSDLRIDADLAATDGGEIAVAGVLDLAAPDPGYQVDARLRAFDFAAVTWRAPAATDLTGVIRARGRGTDPATMRATVAADLDDSGVDDVQADHVRLRLAIDAGLASVDSSVIRLGTAVARLDGSFGLVEGRHGVLAYHVAVDSLHAFAAWLPGADTAVAGPAQREPADIAHVPPVAPPAEGRVAQPLGTPQAQAQAAEGLRAEAVDTPVVAAAHTARRYVAPDGAQVIVTTTVVQEHIDRDTREPPRIRVGALPGDEPDVADLTTDTVSPLARPGVPADSIAGAIEVAGTMSGNVAQFDVEGRGDADELYYRGTYIGSGTAEFAVAAARSPMPDVALDAELATVRTADFAFDSIAVRGRYRGMRDEGAGEAVIFARATDDTEYSADVAFDLALDRSELRVADMVLRFDTVTWRTAQPGVVSWEGDAIELASIDLVSDAGGRIMLDGRLPADGAGDLDVVIEQLEVAQLAALLQLEEQAEGTLNLDARIGGALASPRVSGRMRLDDARLNGQEFPDVRASFSYVGMELAADAQLLSDGRQIATVEARLPLDLSLQPDPAPRLLDGELAIDIVADSLPVESIPALMERVDDVRGVVRGEVAVRGTFSAPLFDGVVDIDLGSVRVVPLDVRFENVAGGITLAGDVLRVDSLVAWSGGPIRMTGEIGVTTPVEPVFALEIEARDALVIDTDDASLELNADITVGGTLARLEVEGEVRTRRGVIYIPQLADLGSTEVVSLHSPATFERVGDVFLEQIRALQRPRPLLERLHIDVAVVIDTDVWLRSTEANVEIYTPREVGPLYIRMNGADGLALEGTINTDRGQYEFMSRRFELTRGAATFTGDPDINPILQIVGEHEIRLPGREAFDIRVLLGGTMRDLEITLESTAQPPIAQTDLLAYLAFGRDASGLLHRQGSALSGQGGDAGELVGNVAGMAAQQLGTVALNALVNDVESDLMRELRLDVFRISPADLPPDMFTGSYIDVLRATEIEAGRYVSPRLFVAGQAVAGLARPGIRVEYTTPFGVRWLTSWQARWLPTEPTLTEQDPRRAGVLGSFLRREWRF